MVDRLTVRMIGGTLFLRRFDDAGPRIAGGDRRRTRFGVTFVMVGYESEVQTQGAHTLQSFTQAESPGLAKNDWGIAASYRVPTRARCNGDFESFGVMPTRDNLLRGELEFKQVS